MWEKSVVCALMEAVRDQRALHGIEAQTAVVQTGPEFWNRVSDRGEQLQLVSASLRR